MLNAVRGISSAQLSAIGRDLFQELQRRTAASGGLAPMETSEFHMLCYSVINCETLREVIERMSAFCRMLRGRAGEITCRVSEDSVEVVVRRFYTADRWEDFIIDCFSLFTWHRLFSWLIGEGLPLTAVHVAYRAPLGEGVTSAFFARDVGFSQSDNLLRFPVRFLDSRVVQTYRTLLELLEVFPFDFTVPEYEVRALSERMAVIYRNALAKHEPLPSLSDVAHTLGLSQATLRRRLVEEETSAEELKDACRLDRAREYLEHPSLTIEEISGLLGFSSAKTFRKGFRKWSGISPSRYRKSLR